MKIAYAAQVPLPSNRAYAVHAMHMCKALAELGHEVKLFAMPPTHDAVDVHKFYGMEPDFTVDHVPMSKVRGIAGPLFGTRIVRRAKATGCELIYARHIYAAAAAHAMGLEVIYEAHQPVSNGLHRLLLARLLRDKTRPGFVVITEALRRRYCADFGIEPERVIVAHDAADLPTARNAELAGNGFRVGYVGNLYPGKGIEVLIEAARIIPDVPFDIVGGRPEDLLRWRSCSPPPNMHFYGHVPHGHLQRHFDKMDVLLLPLQHRVSPDGGSADIAQWTSPMKMFEYMAQGKPIIASDLPVLQEVLSHGETAYIVPAADAQTWAAAIVFLQQNQNTAHKIAAAALEKIKANHTWTGRAQHIIDRAILTKQQTNFN